MSCLTNAKSGGMRNPAACSLQSSHIRVDTKQSRLKWVCPAITHQQKYPRFSQHPPATALYRIECKRLSLSPSAPLMAALIVTTVYATAMSALYLCTNVILRRAPKMDYYWAAYGCVPTRSIQNPDIPAKTSMEKQNR
eukprot:SAG31_NODE_4107_length_3576_cov_19.051769_2_plen_138_part_00